MYRRIAMTLLALTLCACAALAVAIPHNTPTPMPAVKVKMQRVVDMTSTALFTTAGEADPSNGADQKLPTATGWVTVKRQADSLKAVGDFLANAKVAKPEANWMKYAKEMSSLSAMASKAAVAKDAKALAQAANDLSDNCAGCHKIYKTQS